MGELVVRWNDVAILVFSIIGAAWCAIKTATIVLPLLGWKYVG